MCMTDEELKCRLSDFEDGWTERKENIKSTDDIRKTLVAFANSVPDGDEAVLFVGVADGGNIIGVDNPEKAQNSISKTASEWCYPPIKHTARVIGVNGKYIVAAIVQASHNKPHFAGPAFIRSGSQSKKASEEVFNQLIASRISKARPLLESKYKGEGIIIFYWPYGKGNLHAGPKTYADCAVVECTPHYVVLKPPGNNPI
ncbi:MAG: hypothetical protein DMF66_07890, partial [Acidobacteria bacterium]